jgi:hypothetical protein
MWCGVQNWMDTEGALPNSAISHVRIFSGLEMYFLNIKDSCKVIWLTVIWMIWKIRNDRVFNQKVFYVDFVIFNVKLQVWWWFKTKSQLTGVVPLNNVKYFPQGTITGVF